MWMRRCDIDAQMCGGGEVHLDVSMSRYSREGEGGCEGVTVWMCRCDIDAQMCGGGEVHMQM